MISGYFEQAIFWANIVIILYRVYCIIRFDLWKVRNDPPRAAGAPGDDIRVLIIIPLLREQGNARSLLEQLSALHTGKEDRILFVTTEKELSDRKANAYRLRPMAADLARRAAPGRIAAKYAILFNREKLFELNNRLRGQAADAIYAQLTGAYQTYPTTHDMLQYGIQALPGHLQERFQLIDHPRTDGMMADQINFGYAWATAAGQRYDYICLLTGDSYVAPSFLERFKKKVKEFDARYNFRPSVIQCISLFGKNHRQAGTTAFENCMLQGNGVFQSGFSILNELLPMLQTERKIRRRKSAAVDLFSVPALIGHGCLIDVRLFESHSGFPVNGWCEDIILTHIYTAQQAPILALDNEFELNEVPCSIGSLLSQMSTWAHSAVQLMLSPATTFRQAVASGGPARRLHFFRCLVKRWALNIAWMVNPPALSIFLLTGSWMAATAIFLNFLITFQTGYIYNKEYGLTGRPKYLILPGCLFYFMLIYPLAFYYGAVKYVVSLSGRVEKVKTER